MAENVLKCKSCGSPIHSNTSKCDHCDTIIDAAKYSAEQKEKERIKAEEIKRIQLKEESEKSSRLRLIKYIVLASVIFAGVLGLYLKNKGINIAPADVTAQQQDVASKPPQQLRVSPSFDCRKAKSTAEKLICSDNELAQLDIELSKVYSRAKQVAVDRELLKQQTREAWQWRENNCSDINCLRSWYVQRKNSLLEFINSQQSQSYENDLENMPIYDVIKKYFASVEAKDVDAAIAMYSESIRPNINRNTLESIAKDTESYQIINMKVDSKDVSKAIVSTLITHKKYSRNEETWLVTMTLVSENNDWKIYSTPGKKVNE